MRAQDHIASPMICLLPVRRFSVEHVDHQRSWGIQGKAVGATPTRPNRHLACGQSRQGNQTRRQRYTDLGRAMNLSAVPAPPIYAPPCAISSAIPRMGGGEIGSHRNGLPSRRARRFEGISISGR